MQNIYSLKNVQHIKDILNSFYPVIVLDSSEILNQRDCQPAVSLCRSDELLGLGVVKGGVGRKEASWCEKAILLGVAKWYAHNFPKFPQRES